MCFPSRVLALETIPLARVLKEMCAQMITSRECARWCVCEQELQHRDRRSFGGYGGREGTFIRRNCGSDSSSFNFEVGGMKRVSKHEVQTNVPGLVDFPGLELDFDDLTAL